MDYQKEIEKYPDMPDSDRQELEKLASMQKDIAVGESAEDFVRHPFFKFFENKMNQMINDSKNKILEVGSVEELKSYQAGIAAIKELKGWLNSHVIKGRVAKQAIDQYEKDTEELNLKIQAKIDQSRQS